MLAPSDVQTRVPILHPANDPPAAPPQSTPPITTANDAIEQATADNGLYGDTHPQTIDNLHASREQAIERANREARWGDISQIQQAYAQAEAQLNDANDDYVARTTVDDVRDKLASLENPDDWADPSYAQQQNLQIIADATELLANATEGMDDPAAAAALIKQVWGELQQAAQDNYNYGASFENKALLEQTGRLAATAQAAGNTELFDQLVSDAESNPAMLYVTPDEYGVSQMTLDPKAAMQGLPLYLAMAEKARADGAEAPYALVDDILSYNDSQIHDLTEQYVEHTRELNWLIANQGRTASPEQLQQAVDHYVSNQSEEWRSTYDSLQQQLADHGEQLLDAMSQISKQVSDPAAAAQLIETLGASPEAQFALQTALDQNPALASEAKVTVLRDWLAEASTAGGGGAKAPTDIARALGTAYLRTQVSDAISAGLNPDGTPDPERMLRELDKLKQQPGLAKSLGMSPAALNDAIDQLGTLNSEIASGRVQTPEQLRSFLDTQIRGSASTNPEAFGADTPQGQLFRGLASTVGALSFAKATETALDDPNFINIANASVQGADVAQQVLQLGTAAGQVSETGAFGRYAGNSGVTKLIGSVGVALTAIGAVQAFEQGDVLQGSLQTVSALGASVAILGAGSSAGPVGLIVGGVAALASLGVSAFREKQDADKYQTDDAKRFLQDVGFNSEAADILYDNSGEGHSPVPLLVQYCADMGLTPEQTTDFINSLASEYDGAHLETFRATAHKLLDDVDGDVSKRGESWRNDDLKDFIEPKIFLWAAANGVRLPG